MTVVVAIPTIAARPGLADETVELWKQRTAGCEISFVVTTAGLSWAAGLNDAWQQVRCDSPDVFVCGSDDMAPADDTWLHAVNPWLHVGKHPAPRVDDPRFINYGGHLQPVPDGTSSDMSTFPILRGDWLDRVLPLPEDLHYFADNLIAVKLARAGVPTVAVPSCRILHLHAQSGRGAGYGSENTRLYIDTVRYTRELDRLGIDRLGLPDGQRGAMWEQHFQAEGAALGA